MAKIAAVDRKIIRKVTLYIFKFKPGKRRRKKKRWIQRNGEVERRERELGTWVDGVAIGPSGCASRTHTAPGILTQRAFRCAACSTAVGKQNGILTRTMSERTVLRGRTDTTVSVEA